MEFKKVKLGEISIITMGQSPKSEFYSEIDGTPFLQGNRTFQHIYPVIDTYTKKVTKLANANDILFSVRAPVGDINIAPVDLCIGRGLCAIRSINNNQEFLFYLLKSKINELESQATGTIFSSVNKKTLENFIVNIPNEKQQKNIGTILSNLDKKIELNQKIIANLEELSQILFKHWFVDFEFSDENGNPYKSSGGEMVDSELGKIPKYWKVSNLDKIASFVSRGITPKYNENSDIQIPIINQKVNKGPRLDLQYIKYFDGQNRIKKELYAQKNDLLLNSLGQGTLGRVHLFTRKSEEFLIDQHISIIRFDNINYSYFYYAHINTDLIQGQIDSLISGSTGMLMLNITKIRNLKVILPTEELVLKYSKLVNEYFGKITQLIYENENLTQLRDTLLPKLMSGEIDIPDDIEVNEDELSI